MSEKETPLEQSHVVLPHLATYPHAPKVETLQKRQLQGEPLSSDVHTFCTLIARIMMRCLKERDPRVMELLALSTKAEEAEIGETHDAA